MDANVCSGDGCGRKLSHAKRPDPNGRLCMECRAKRGERRSWPLLEERQCEGCPVMFRPWRRDTRFHDRTCYDRWRNRGQGDDALRRERNRRKRERRRDPARVAEPYTLMEIAARDEARCGLCQLPVDMALSGLVPDGPTIDHVIPFAQGGDDTRANVQLAHRRCNIAKGARCEALALAG